MKTFIRKTFAIENLKLFVLFVLIILGILSSYEKFLLAYIEFIGVPKGIVISIFSWTTIWVDIIYALTLYFILQILMYSNKIKIKTQK